MVGCTGLIGEPNPSRAPEDQAPTVEPNRPPAATPLTDGWPSFPPRITGQLRRLTTDQYLSSVATLLQIDPSGVPATEPVSPVAGFPAIGASSAGVSSNGVAQFEGAATFLADAALARPTSRTWIVPCTPASTTDTGCFTAFVTTFGRRAFRRPLLEEEIAAYVALTLEVAESTEDPWLGIRSTLTAFLQSPHFLYLAEVGEPDPERPGRVRYTNDEMASRLAYFLSGDTPDDALLDAALAGELTTRVGLEAQIDRLLEKREARAAVRRFFTVFFALDGLDNLVRPPQLYPNFTPTLAAALKEETLATLEDAVFDADLDYRRLYDRYETFLNPELAAFYGVPAPAGPGFSRVTLPAGPRRGLLGQAGVLAVHDHDTTTSPTKRGLFILTRILCQPLALSPPAGVRIPPLPTGELTARQRLTPHFQNDTCAGCHRPMDTVGLSLEHFDALGVYRETDRGLAIDASGTLGTSAYDGAAELGGLLAAAEATGPCLVSSLYGASVGHSIDTFDRDSYAAAVAAFEQSGGRVRAVLKSIAQSDGFRYTTEAN